MQRCRVLVANDFLQKGGAEEVYRQCADLLRTMPGVGVECFDESRFHVRASSLSKSWNVTAARALKKAIVDFQPVQAMVHNYHNLLSAPVLNVIARYKHYLGYTTYLTCQDSHLCLLQPYAEVSRTRPWRIFAARGGVHLDSERHHV